MCILRKFYHETILCSFFSLGATTPINPIDVVHTTLSSKQAEIHWLVPAINYTPENYTVIYGKDEALLNYSRSDTVVGTDDIKEINQFYSVTLEELEANTTYYYQVIARNSFGTNSSDIKTLKTPLSSEFRIGIC